MGGILKNLSGLFNKPMSWKYGGVTVINKKKKHFLKPQHNLLVLLNTGIEEWIMKDNWWETGEGREHNKSQ